jgi:hypothetical protein
MGTFLGVLVTAVLGLITASGVVKFFIEPWWMERSLRKRLASCLWLSCLELRSHLKEIDEKVREQDAQAKDALLKLPGNDYRGDFSWFVKSGYFSMITAYKISAFSSWLRIYQNSLLRYSFLSSSKVFMSELYNLTNEFKYRISENTSLWYYYFDAIGDRTTRRADGIDAPMDFSEFCRNYAKDSEFRGFFDQLHMFIHFLGRDEQEWVDRYRNKLPDLINLLEKVESFLDKENLLKGFHVEKERTTRSNIRGNE